MITFNSLGNLGRLGNQLFQYASLRGIAFKNNQRHMVPKTELFDHFEMVNANIGRQNAPVFQEKNFHFDEELLTKFQYDIDLFGYYQSEKYFKHIEGEIRQDFAFKKHIYEPCWEMIKEIPERMSLHVRRGDYLQKPDCHPPCTIEYYEQALSKFDDSIPVLIFGDDPQWCREQKLFSSDRFMIAEGNTVEVDLCLMAMCQYHILSNSSLAWWAAWLANSQSVVAPKRWFGPSLPHNTDDLYLEHWELIDA